MPVKSNLQDKFGTSHKGIPFPREIINILTIKAKKKPTVWLLAGSINDKKTDLP